MTPSQRSELLALVKFLEGAWEYQAHHSDVPWKRLWWTVSQMCYDNFRFYSHAQ